MHECLQISGNLATSHLRIAYERAECFRRTPEQVFQTLLIRPLPTVTIGIHVFSFFPLPLPRGRLFAGLLLCLWSSLAGAETDIRLGVLAWLGSEEAEVQWKPLVQQLEQRLPGHRILLRDYNLNELSADSDQPRRCRGSASTLRL